MRTPMIEALGVRERDVVVLVGGGGKTTTLFRLGRELLGEGKGVVVTTTTHIFAPAPEADLAAVLAAGTPDAAEGCRAALKRGCLPVLGTHITPEGKLAGISPATVDALAAQDDITHLLVEADGSAHKPFKAPLEYEPVVPLSTTLLIAVVGVDALGAPLDAEHIHRPQRVAELAGVVMGEPLSAEAIARVLMHRLGPLRDAPLGARRLVLLNKADTPERRGAAAQIAHALRAVQGPPAVIGAVARDEPFG